MQFSLSAIYFSLLFFTPTTLSATPPKTIFQFPNPTWIENIFATRNGTLLTSLIGRPELHLVNPFTTPATASLIYSFPGADSVFGIAELEPDTFAVITANYSPTAGPTLHSNSIWKVDLSCGQVSKIADLPEAQVINGAAALNVHTVLVADSYANNIGAVDTRTGEYTVVLEDQSTDYVAGASLRITVNGLKVVNEYVYFSNSAQETINRVKVSLRTGKALAPFERIAGNLSIVDDFAVATDGTVFLTRGYANELQRVGTDGSVVTVAGAPDSTALLTPTSATLGRTWAERQFVYVGTNGGLEKPFNGSFTEGGKVVAVEVY